MRSIAGICLLSCLPAVALAQAYPTKPIRLVVPFPAGGPTDIVSRMIAPRMAAGLGQQIVIENRGGGGGQVGTQMVSKAAADGYTVIMGTIGGIAVSMSLNPRRGYDSLRDFIPITQAVSVTSVVVAHPSVPAKSLPDLLRIAKASPGKLNYASSGNGTVTHLAGELLKLLGKVDITHVPYKGGAPALTALRSGEVDMSFENSLIVTPHIRSGKVRALAVTSAKRSALFPELPTVAETLPGYSASGWYGLLAPAGTPAPIVARLGEEAVKALRSPDVTAQLSSQGAEPVASTPAEFAAFIRAEIDKWGGVVKAANMRVD